MIQYYDNLIGSNLAEAHQRVANDYMEEVRKHPEVIGVVLLGGAARGFADKNSDIDLVVFVSRKGFNAIPRGEPIWREHHLDVGVVYYPFASRQEWTMVQRWTYAEAKVLYDPSGKIQSLLKRKVTFPKQERKLVLVDRIMRLGWYGINYKEGFWRGYHFFKTPDFWVRRGDITSAHQILNFALDMLLDILFAYNEVLIPDEKWKFHIIHSLSWLPKNFRHRFQEVILLRELTKEEFESRLEGFLSLYRETMEEIEQHNILPQNIYRYLVKHSTYFREDSV